MTDDTTGLPRDSDVSPAARTTLARRLLIVDDDVATTEGLAQLLELGGASVDTANDGEVALVRLAQERFDVVLSDLGMPDMDGYAFAGRARKLLLDHCPKLVALSGYARPDDIRRAHEAGFDLHLAKPFSMEALDEALEELLKQPEEPT
jgi:two-component system, chemotaxis family, CheB/CheR fusion protein